MKETFKNDLNEFLEKQGVLEIPNNNKEMLKVLNEILFSLKFNQDCIEYDRDYGTTTSTEKEFSDTINNITFDLISVRYFIDNIKLIRKKEKKANRFKIIKKVFKK